MAMKMWRYVGPRHKPVHVEFWIILDGLLNPMYVTFGGAVHVTTMWENEDLERAVMHDGTTGYWKQVLP